MASRELTALIHLLTSRPMPENVTKLTGARALTRSLPNSPWRRILRAKKSMPLVCRQNG